MTNAALLPAKDYIEDLPGAIARSKKRVYLMSLAISDDPLTHDVFAELKQAAKRGVETSVAADSFTFSEFGGYFSPFKRRMARSKAADKLARRLRAAGATFRWLGGGHKFNPFAGVTHIKWAIIDDTVYCFGGVNLYQEAIEHTDYMLKIHDPRLAKELVEEQDEIINADVSFRRYDGLYKPFEFGTVYVDSGNRGSSIIYNRACELAGQAVKITFVSQYCPSGRLAEILKKKPAKIYFNRPVQAGFYARLFIRYAMWRHGLTSLYARENYLHAKFILFEMKNSQTIALTGSHNFSYTGVNFGTREVALETSNTRVVRQLEAFYKKNVA